MNRWVSAMGRLPFAVKVGTEVALDLREHSIRCRQAALRRMKAKVDSLSRSLGTPLSGPFPGRIIQFRTGKESPGARRPVGGSNGEGCFCH
jgi:hypothetical protein